MLTSSVRFSPIHQTRILCRSASGWTKVVSSCIRQGAFSPTFRLLPRMGNQYVVHIRRSPRTFTSATKVHTKYATHEERKIDIVLEMPGNRWIGIENKPWAAEQKDQVKAYLEYLQSRVKRSRTARILYLSGNGSDPKTLPTELKDFCWTVSYRKNDTRSSLESWIEQCWRECEAERVRWFLKDLLEYIQRKFKEENQIMAQDITVDTTMPAASAAVATSAYPSAHRRSRAHRRYFPSPDR